MNESHAASEYPGSPSSSGGPSGSIDGLLKDFDRHLEGQRGCAEGTRRNYRREARAFLVYVFPAQSINWKGLTAGKMVEFVSSRAKKLSLVSRQNPAIAMRSLLRFLAGKGLIQVGLEGAIPPIWRTKHATVPRHVSSEQLDRILALSSLEERPRTLRDHAMVLLCARLGLRPGEVLSLTLNDLDWNASCVLIRAGKTSRERVLPVPEDAGAALARYRAPSQTPPQRRNRDRYGQSSVATSGSWSPVLRRLRFSAHAGHNHGPQWRELQTGRRYLGT